MDLLHPSVPKLTHLRHAQRHRRERRLGAASRRITPSALLVARCYDTLARRVTAALASNPQRERATAALRPHFRRGRIHRGHCPGGGGSSGRHGCWRLLWPQTTDLCMTQHCAESDFSSSRHLEPRQLQCSRRSGTWVTGPSPLYLCLRRPPVGDGQCTLPPWDILPREPFQDPERRRIQTQARDSCSTPPTPRGGTPPPGCSSEAQEPACACFAAMGHSRQRPAPPAVPRLSLARPLESAEMGPRMY